MAQVAALKLFWLKIAINRNPTGLSMHRLLRRIMNFSGFLIALPLHHQSLTIRIFDARFNYQISFQ
jgi:hypothetical protein